MKKIFIAVCIITMFQAQGQITKGNWLIGGSGSLFSYSRTYSSSDFSFKSRGIDISISPGIGFFITDKLAGGTRLRYSKSKEDSESGGHTNENRFEFGPFARYYLLKQEKRYNLLTDFSYMYGRYWFKPTKGYINTLLVSAGPVIYFNTSVGLELLMGYYLRKEVQKHSGDYIHNRHGLQLSLGLQVCLEKRDD